MKNILSRLRMLLFMIFLTALVLPQTAFAANSRVIFDGIVVDGVNRSGKFTFKTGSAALLPDDLFDDFKGVMPGDSLTDEIEFVNGYSEPADLYLEAVPRDAAHPMHPLVAAHEQTTERMNDFLSRLYLKVWNGDQLIYDAPPGGKFSAGLVSLGIAAPHETKTLRLQLEVPITLGNEYQNRMGEVVWQLRANVYDSTELAVIILWKDGSAAHSDDTLHVNLTGDGTVLQRFQPVDGKMQWTRVFGGLEPGKYYDADLADPPEGYTMRKERDGNVIRIYLAPESGPSKPHDPDDGDPPKPPLPSDPEDDPWDDPEEDEDDWLRLEVRWDPGAKESQIPEWVRVFLYDGDEKIDVVYPGDRSRWRHEWRHLPPNSGDYHVLEVTVPEGFTPHYSREGNTLVITNLLTLVQTGQLRWPVPVLIGSGLLLVVLGLLLRRKRKKGKSSRA